ncbi:Hypothetical predicted protein [Olea europaea subsp. europaea]|uniref:Uncharacterized protein n=1 Tax=Olea europaea subsp. europaea TaxID=158383 RepID=A0A8S0UU15_OLEEU|nr:Hypothetical predicted protein [Olea europaea subsp. europaea]
MASSSVYVFIPLDFTLNLMQEMYFICQCIMMINHTVSLYSRRMICFELSDEFMVLHYNILQLFFHFLQLRNIKASAQQIEIVYPATSEKCRGKSVSSVPPQCQPTWCGYSRLENITHT